MLAKFKLTVLYFYCAHALVHECKVRYRHTIFAVCLSFRLSVCLSVCPLHADYITRMSFALQYYFVHITWAKWNSCLRWTLFLSACFVYFYWKETLTAKFEAVLRAVQMYFRPQNTANKSFLRYILPTRSYYTRHITPYTFDNSVRGAYLLLSSRRRVVRS